MKKLLAFLPLLFACGETMMQVPMVKPTAAEMLYPMTPHSMVSRGSNGEVSWKCFQQDYNINTIQINCSFLNLTDKEQAILLETYISNINGDGLMDAEINSGHLSPREEKENISYITKENRKTLLTYCGIDTSLCTLHTKIIYPKKENQ